MMRANVMRNLCIVLLIALVNGKEKKCKNKCYGPSLYKFEGAAGEKETSFKEFVEAHKALFPYKEKGNDIKSFSKLMDDWNEYTSAVSKIYSTASFDEQYLVKQEADPKFKMVRDKAKSKGYRASATTINRVRTEKFENQCPVEDFPEVGVYDLHEKIGNISPIFLGQADEADGFCFDVTAIRDSDDVSEEKKKLLLPNTYLTRFTDDIWKRFGIVRHGRVQAKEKFMKLVGKVKDLVGKSGLAFSWMLHGAPSNLYKKVDASKEYGMVQEQTEIWHDISTSDIGVGDKFKFETERTVTTIINKSITVKKEVLDEMTITDDASLKDIEMTHSEKGFLFMKAFNVFTNEFGRLNYKDNLANTLLKVGQDMNERVKEIVSHLAKTGMSFKAPVLKFPTAKKKAETEEKRLLGNAARKAARAKAATPESFATFLLEIVSIIVTSAFFYLKKNTEKSFLLFFNCKSGLDRTGYIYALFIAFVAAMKKHLVFASGNLKEDLQSFQNQFINAWKSGEETAETRHFRQVYLQTLISISAPITYISTGIRGIKSPSFGDVIKEFFPSGDELKLWIEHKNTNARKKMMLAFVNDVGKNRGA